MDFQNVFQGAAVRIRRQHDLRRHRMILVELDDEADEFILRVAVQRRQLEFLFQNRAAAHEETLDGDIAAVGLDAMQARPVLTTATDVQGYTAPDAVAAELGLRPEPKRNIKYINQRLLLDQPVTYIVDRSLPQADYFAQYLIQMPFYPY